MLNPRSRLRLTTLCLVLLSSYPVFAETLGSDEEFSGTLDSPNGNYRLNWGFGFGEGGFGFSYYLAWRYTPTGNFLWGSVVDSGNWGYGSHNAQWAAVGSNPHAYMGNDGNFVMYNGSWSPVWETNTDGHTGAYVSAQNDGNLVVYDSGNNPLWSLF
jgi:hypothetical protein